MSVAFDSLLNMSIVLGKVGFVGCLHVDWSEAAVSDGAADCAGKGES